MGGVGPGSFKFLYSFGVLEEEVVLKYNELFKRFEC